MKKQTNLIFCSILLTVILSSCSKAIYYSPDSVSDIGLTHAGDIQTSVTKINVSNVHSDDNSGFNELDVSIAYSPVKHLGLYYNTYGYKEKYNQKVVDEFVHVASIPTPGIPFLSIPIGYPKFDNITYSFSQRLSQFGAGYYTSQDNYNFEVYGVTGYGRIALSNEINKVLRTDIRKNGIRSAITWKLGALEAGMGAAFSRLEYLNITGFGESNRFDELNYIRNHDQHNLLEGNINFKYNMKWGKIKLESGTSRSNDNNFRMNNRYAGIGFILDVDHIFKNIFKKLKSK